MRLSEISIQRPVLATVMSLLIAVAGAIGFLSLPVREYPDVDRPVVGVWTPYPGASPETVESTVTEPLEQVLNGLDGIRTIESRSAYGVSSIDLEFEAGRDIDLAAADVSNAIQRGLGRLPDGAERPVVSKASADGQASLWLTLRGDRYGRADLTDLAERIAKPRLQMLSGVARVETIGQHYAMRIWLDPVEMAARRVDAADVRRAIRENNLQVPAGEIEAATRKFTVNVLGRLADPRDYERIVIREDDGIPVRIGDVGWVELGADDYQRITRHTAQQVVGIGVVRQSRSNELEVAAGIRAALPEILQALPEDVELDIAIDNSGFVEASLREVTKTLGIVFVLVVLVNLFFLRSPTSTAITALAIPVSLVGTLALMQLVGFSINVLTLLSLVLAIGLVVDDSIVVMENVYRRRETGESPLRAAFNGSREVGFPVIATTAAVVAVLVPLSLMGGNTGRLFREFAGTMTGAILISTFVALSLVPTLCSRFLSLDTTGGRVSSAVERLLQAITAAYGRALDWSLAHRRIAGAFLLGTFVALAAIYAVTPNTFVPTEDRGMFVTPVQAPQGSTAAYTFAALEQAEALVLTLPELQGVFATVASTYGGVSNSSDGNLFVRLRPWGERSRSAQEIVASLQPELNKIPQALAFAILPGSLGQYRQSDIHVVVKSSDADLETLRAVTRRALDRLAEIPGLINVDTNLKLENPQLDIHFDRERASDIGVPVSSVAESLRLLIAQGAADEFVLRNRQYDVVMALASSFRSVPEQLGEIHVRAQSGAMVPLSALIEVRPVVGATTLNHYDLQRSATLTASLLPSTSLGDALPRVLAAVDAELPTGFATALGGISREFRDSSGAILVTFGIALLVIYLVLAAQFESFVHPVTVMVGVPLASLGALLALLLTGHTLNVYSQVGIVLLVGLVTKNSILLVDFANQERARGTDLLPALARAGRTRFRPILMTSSTSILGAMPLALAAGAGAESRQAIGTVVVGGLLFSTVFTLLVTPVVHYVVTRSAERIGLQTIPPLVELEADAPPGEQPTPLPARQAS